MESIPSGRPAHSRLPVGCAVVMLALTACGSDSTKVPHVVGKKLDVAEKILDHAGLHYTFDYTASLPLKPPPANTVVAQSPSAASVRPRGSTVTLSVVQ